MLRCELNTDPILTALAYFDAAEFIRTIKAWAGWITVFSLVTFVMSIWIVSWLIIRMPADYFDFEHRPFEKFSPAARLALRILTSLAGVVLILIGIVMLVGPGQGVITILLGLSVLQFPGKRRLISWILRRKSVRRGMNWIRRKAGRPALQFDQILASAQEQQSSASSGG